MVPPRLPSLDRSEIVGVDVVGSEYHSGCTIHGPAPGGVWWVRRGRDEADPARGLPSGRRPDRHLRARHLRDRGLLHASGWSRTRSSSLRSSPSRPRIPGASADAVEEQVTRRSRMPSPASATSRRSPRPRRRAYRDDHRRVPGRRRRRCRGQRRPAAGQRRPPRPAGRGRGAELRQARLQRRPGPQPGRDERRRGRPGPSCTGWPTTSPVRAWRPSTASGGSWSSAARSPRSRSRSSRTGCAPTA